MRASPQGERTFVFAAKRRTRRVATGAKTGGRGSPDPVPRTEQARPKGTVVRCERAPRADGAARRRGAHSTAFARTTGAEPARPLRPGSCHGSAHPKPATLISLLADPGTVYGDTPPSIVAIEPAVLQDAAGCRHVAWLLEQAMRRRPTWAVVGPAPSLLLAAPGMERTEAMRSLADDAAWRPPPRRGPRGTRPTEATAAVLEHHLEQGGVRPQRAGADDIDSMPRPSAALVLAGSPGLPAAVPVAAMALARALGVAEVSLWRRAPVGTATRDAAAAAGVRLRVGLPDVRLQA